MNHVIDKIIREHDVVVLLQDCPDEDLVAGDSGVVVQVYSNAPAYEVEFPHTKGSPRFVVVTLNADQVLKLQPRSRIRAAS